MAYQFYPRKDDPCPNVGHCPHVGGAAIASLVMIGNENQLYLRQLHGTIDAEKERNRRLFEENEKLSKVLEQRAKRPPSPYRSSFPLSIFIRTRTSFSSNSNL